MNYVTILACVAILFVSLAVFAIAARKKGARFIATVCIMVTALELVIFIVWPIPNYRYESVEVTALNAANAEDGGKEVFIKSVTMRGAEIAFPEVESGRWFWRNGMYSWRPPEDKNQPEGCTETIVLRVPVGEERAINFTSNRWKGLVAVTAGGEREERDLYSEEDGTVSVLLPDSGMGELIKNAAVRIAVYLGIHGAVLAGVILVCRYLLEKIAAAIGKCRYELAFCVCAFMMVVRYGSLASTNTYSFLYNSSYYVNGYEFGFIKRGLIGQLAMSLTPHISAAQMQDFLQICTLVVVVLLSILLGRAVRRQKSEAARWFFVMVVCSFPSTFMFVSDPLRPDIYEIILFIACAAAVYKGRALWSIPMLVCVIMLINETSCAYMVPPILMMLAYKWAKNQAGGVSFEKVYGSCRRKLCGHSVHDRMDAFYSRPAGGNGRQHSIFTYAKASWIFHILWRPQCEPVDDLRQHYIYDGQMGTGRQADGHSVFGCAARMRIAGDRLVCLL